MPNQGLPSRMQFPLAACLLAAALVLGGGQGTLGDAGLQLLALSLVTLCLWRHAHEPGAGLPRRAWLAALPLVLPLLQLMPVPEALWRLPSARAELAAELELAGVAAANRWSLVPLATERALAWLLPASALYLACLQLGKAQRVVLLRLIAALAAASVLLGLAQLAGGKDSALRFYSNTNTTEAVGFFANRNHLASLLALALPLVVVGTARWLGQRDGWDARSVLGLVAGIGLVALLILGIAMARSRAGLLLGMIGLAASALVVLAMRRRRGTRRALAVAVAFGLTLAVQFALFGIMQRLESDPLDDARFRFLPVIAEVSDRHAPLGTGLGGFRRAFEAEQRPPEAYYVNQAHNDWAQAWFEGGWPGLVLAGLALALLVLAGWHAWRPAGDGTRGPEVRRVAWLGLVLLALHSLADYPLRTSAMLAVAGVLAGVVAAPSNRTPSRHEQGSLRPNAA